MERVDLEMGEVTRALDAGGAGGARYTLSEVLELAVARNPSLAVFLANIDAVQGEARTAAAYPNPSLFAQGGRGKPRWPDEGVISPGTEYQTTGHTFKLCLGD